MEVKTEVEELDNQKEGARQLHDCMYGEWWWKEGSKGDL